MKKVLVVEDDGLIRMIIVQALKEMGHESEECNNGADAIAKLELNRYGLLITDVVMPEKSGVSVAEYIKKNSIPTPVLAISSSTTGLEFASYYADDTLKKPFKKQELIEIIGRLLSGGSIDAALENM